MIVTRGARAKVYAHLMAMGVPGSHASLEDGTQVYLEGDRPAPGDAAEVISLWDQLGAMYAIRNSVAHTGEYTPISGRSVGAEEALAARLYPSLSLHQNLRELARLAMHQELAALP